MAASAQANSVVQYHIRAQDLGTALTELARQSKREIYFSSDLTRGRRAPSISGQLTVEQALDRLLQGSGLTYRINSSAAIAIVSAEGNARAAAEVASSKGNADLSPATESDSGRAIVVTGTHIRGGDNPTQPIIVLDRKYIAETG